MRIDEVRQLIEQGEGQTIEFKDSRILSSPIVLAKEMVAFANTEGGLILLGVRDNGSIEGMRYREGHQQFIMNVASDRCDPPIRPSFEVVRYNDEGDVYVISVPKRTQFLHGVTLKRQALVSNVTT